MPCAALRVAQPCCARVSAFSGIEVNTNSAGVAHERDLPDVGGERGAGTEERKKKHFAHVCTGHAGGDRARVGPDRRLEASI